MKNKIFILSCSILLTLTGCVTFEPTDHSTGWGSKITKSTYSVNISEIEPASLPSTSNQFVLKMKNDALKGAVPANQTEIKGWISETPVIINTLGAYDTVTLAPVQAGVGGGLMIGASYTTLTYFSFTTTKPITSMLICARPGFDNESEDPEISQGFYVDKNVKIGVNNFGFISLKDDFSKPVDIKYTNCTYNFEATTDFTIAVNSKRAIIDKIVCYY